ncbi:hypothetical protein Psi02_45970 [Planotetraspora silvatica]|uniref:Uncharacterized protein n=1 Tax=Planotetraspora silvatica TaxID=234614 RepID=A0A8J3UN02_9ACTN|nr:hypothetical protein Psi02_45970 [Planotetraspora silvatica]
MVTPEVVGRSDPVCVAEIDDEREARKSTCRAGPDPAHPAVSGVVAHLTAEGVAMEGKGGVRVVMREEGLVSGDVHGGQAMRGPVTGASPKLLT